MAGFLKRLFGGDNNNVDPATLEPNEVYKGVEIRGVPMAADGGQWRIAGTLTKTDGSETISRRFIRADLVQSREEAVKSSVEKAKMIIDQNGSFIWQGDENQPV